MHIATAQSSVQLFNRTSHIIFQFTRLPTIGPFFFWETSLIICQKFSDITKCLWRYKKSVFQVDHDERPCVVDRIWLSVCEVNTRISKCYQLPFFVSASCWDTDDSKPTLVSHYSLKPYRISRKKYQEGPSSFAVRLFSIYLKTVFIRNEMSKVWIASLARINNITYYVINLVYYAIRTNDLRIDRLLARQKNLLCTSSRFLRNYILHFA